MSLGDFREGQIVDLATMSQIVNVEFPPGQPNAIVTLTADGTFAPVQYTTSPCN